MIINVPKSDLLRGQPIQPGWYKAEVVEFKAAPSKDQQSMNYTPVFRLETPNQETAETNFNSKLLSMMGPYLAALDGVPLKNYLDAVNGALVVDTEKHIGKKLQIKIKNEPWEGRLMNRIEAFLPYDAVVPF